MTAVFENSKFKIELTKDKQNNFDNKRYYFKITIKDFDTPDLHIEYDGNEKVVVRTWINEDESENLPKNHVVYKMFSLIEYEVLEIIQFVIKHM